MGGFLFRLFTIFCCPCILIFQSIRILLCGFLYDTFKGCGLCMKSCCCGMWAAICCCFSCCNKRYVDKKFPPNRKSLGDNVQKAAEARWLRLEDLCGGPDEAVLVRGGISPCEIGQGGLGNCWLLAAMASLAEFPPLVRDVFVVKSNNEYQKYTFRLFDDRIKKFRLISVDTLVPCIRGQPMFTRPEQNAMWVPLLEKAVAKMYGSYGALDGGTMERGLRILSGATIVKIFRSAPGSSTWVRSNSYKTYKTDMIHDLVRNFDYHKSIMTCSIKKSYCRATTTELRGLQVGHAYTLVGAMKVDDVRLFKLRNPWGTGGWRGAWGDRSREWEKHPSIRKAVKQDNRNDGVFFMEERDFLHYFDSLALGVRDVGFGDIAYEPNEGECCGSCTGLCCGCCMFWCCCDGMKALCCYHDANPEMEAYDHCC